MIKHGAPSLLTFGIPKIENEMFLVSTHGLLVERDFSTDVENLSVCTSSCMSLPLWLTVAV